jgi:choline kinase
VIQDAVILAAGMGTRIRQSDSDLPKPLHEVGGVSLLNRTILSLRNGGVRRVVVVTGFMATALDAAIDAHRDFYAAHGVVIETVFNPDYALSNGISVVVGGRRCDGPFVLSMADHLYSNTIVEMLRAQDLGKADLYLATDTRIGSILDLDDATKVRSLDGKIVQIGKTIQTYDRIDCGVFVVGHALLDALDQVREERKSADKPTGDCSLSQGVQKLAERGRARIADIGDAWWQDVDTPADMSHAVAVLQHAALVEP